MNYQLLRQSKIERHLKLWIYLLPIIGVIPAIYTLYLSPTKDIAVPNDNLAADREQKKASRLSLNLALVWSVAYALLFLSSANASEIMSFRLLYANTILTSAYFVTCTVLMSQLGRKTISEASHIEGNSRG